MHNWHSYQTMETPHSSDLNDWRSDCRKVDNQTEQGVKDVFVFTCTAVLLEWQQTHSSFRKNVEWLKNSSMFSCVISKCVVQTELRCELLHMQPKSRRIFVCKETCLIMTLTMANRKAFQHSGSWAKVWRMTSSRARQPIADISGGRTCWLRWLMFLWKKWSIQMSTFAQAHSHFKCISTYLTSAVVNGKRTSCSTFLNWMQNLQETNWKH